MCFSFLQLFFLNSRRLEDLREALNAADWTLWNPTNLQLLLFCAAQPLGKEPLNMPVLSNCIPKVSSWHALKAFQKHKWQSGDQMLEELDIITYQKTIQVSIVTIPVAASVFTWIILSLERMDCKWD